MGLPTDFTLNTGSTIPAVGLGTWKSDKGQVRKAVVYALKNGYRHIDAALHQNIWYEYGKIARMSLTVLQGNEEEVGQGIKDSGVARKDIFLTSKLWNTHQDNVEDGLERTLKALGTDYLDLYVRVTLGHRDAGLLILTPSSFTGLFDWYRDLLPVNPDGSRSVDPTWDQRQTWRQMENIYKSGRVKAIGLANWSIPFLEDLRKMWTIVPAVNQVELHPFLPQHELRSYCEKYGILLEAYSPLGSTGAPLMSDSDIQRIATKYGVSSSTILLSYHVNKGTVVLPKSVSEQRIVTNRELIEIHKEDMAALDSVANNGKAKRLNTPAWGSDLGFADWYGPIEIS